MKKFISAFILAAMTAGSVECSLLSKKDAAPTLDEINNMYSFGERETIKDEIALAEKQQK